MGFFGFGNGGDRDKQAQSELAQGRLPSYVIERLRREKAGELPWTSTLSVPDWLLLSRYQVRPVGQVMGSSFYHLGYSSFFQSFDASSSDLTQFEDALVECRALALGRLEMEARELGANAVVDVKIEARQNFGEGHRLEYTAMGTAVRAEGLQAPDKPVLCSVSADDLAKLLAAGALPVGIAMGVGVRFHFASYSEAQFLRSWQNQRNVEMDHTWDADRVRKRAIASLKRDAERFGASLVLARDTGMRVFRLERSHSSGDDRTHFVIEFIASGTAVSLGSKSALSEKPRIVLNVGKQKGGNKNGQ